MTDKLRPPDPLTMTAIGAEVISARLKFPNNTHLLAALVEEVGEVARALLERKDRDDLERECLQVAAMAVRIIEEGAEVVRPHSVAHLCAHCASVARYRYTWPGKSESYACPAHGQYMGKVADAMGMELQLISLEATP